MQPQGHVQVALRLLGAGSNPQAALDAPRWRAEDGTLMVEPAWGAAFLDGLRARGHVLAEATSLDVGAGQVIWRLGGEGYVAASESRRDGQAVGF
jgi:gamma-glutamyltranspeptidase/glutathione hydrolase